MLNFDAIKACSYFLPKSDTYSYAGIHLLPTAEAIRLEATDGHIAIRIEYTPEEIWADMEEAFYSLSQVKVCPFQGLQYTGKQPGSGEGLPGH